MPRVAPPGSPLRARAAHPARPRRLALGVALAVVAAVVAAIVAAVGMGLGCSRKRPPNLVLVTLDTLRVDRVGALGGRVDATPHLDALAREGLVHEAAFTTMPTTGPAHLSLLTGHLPSRHGCEHNGQPMRADERVRSLPVRLSQHGYTTGAFVTSPVLGLRATGLTGFDRFDEPVMPIRPGQEAVDAALRWLDQAREPVFLWVHIYDAHAPYGRPATKVARLPLDLRSYGFVDRSRYADPAEREHMAEEYTEGVRAADAALGRLIEGARKRLSPAPLIVVASDHGESLDEHLEDRGYAYDHGEYLDPEEIHIVTVLAGPGVAPGRSTGATSIRDLYTTFLAAAGIPDPDAAAEGRRDLRVPSDAPREVVVERRQIGTTHDQVPPESRAGVLAQALAVTDGRSRAVVGEDGSVTIAEGPGADGLARTARAFLAAETARPGLPSAEIDPALSAALRSLGYAAP